MPLFGRVYKLIVGQAGQGGVEITGLRVTFDIEKTATPRPNNSKLVIYNLAPATRAMMEKPDTKCILSAGYTEDRGALLMFSGAVDFAYTQKIQADIATTLELHDGHVALRDTMVSIGQGKGASAKAVIKSTAGQLGMPLVMDEALTDRTWGHGFSYYGPARHALKRVTAAAGMEWSVQNGALQVVPAGGTTLRQAIVLGGESGLIGPPERTRKGQEQAALVKDLATGANPVNKPLLSAQRRKFDGWRVKSLLMPTINPGDPVILNSAYVQGSFRAETVRHTGDSEGGDWQTEIELLTASDYSAKATQDADKARKRAISLAKAPKVKH